MHWLCWHNWTEWKDYSEGKLNIYYEDKIIDTGQFITQIRECTKCKMKVLTTTKVRVA